MCCWMAGVVVGAENVEAWTRLLWATVSYSLTRWPETFHAQVIQEIFWETVSQKFGFMRTKVLEKEECKPWLVQDLV